MNRKYFIISVIGCLLIGNLILLYFLVQKPKMNRDYSSRSIIIETLKFDDQQTSQYDTLIAIHKKEIKDRNDQIRDLKNVLYVMLPNDTISKVKVDSLTSQIGNIQRDIEVIHFNHFMDIKQLCKPSQHDAFQKLSSDLQKIFHAKRHPEKKPK
jgi:periplasmic protein CpxP/Spy